MAEDNKKYKDRLFNFIFGAEENKESILECKYDFAMNNLYRTQKTTYEYLKELIAENYKDAQDVYNDLYKISVSVVVNDDMTSLGENELTYGNSRVKTWAGSVFIKVNFSGGTPDMDAIDVWGDATCCKNGTWKGYYDIWGALGPIKSGSSFKCSAKMNTWSFVGNPNGNYGQFMVSNDYSATKIVFNYKDVSGETCSYTVDLKRK